MNTELIKDVVIVVGMPVLRSVIGWIENAIKDKTITRFEWRQLITTITRVGTVGLVAYFGLGSIGMDIPAVAVGASAWIFDKVISAMKEKRSIK